MEKTSKHVNYIRNSNAFNARLEGQAKNNLSGAERAFAGKINMTSQREDIEKIFNDLIV